MSDEYDDATLAAMYASPCDTYFQLLKAYHALISGSQRQKVTFGERTTWYHPGDATRLLAEINRFGDACKSTNPQAAKQLGLGNLQPRGFGLTLGSRSPSNPYKF